MPDHHDEPMAFIHRVGIDSWVMCHAAIPIVRRAMRATGWSSLTVARALLNLFFALLVAGLLIDVATTRGTPYSLIILILFWATIGVPLEHRMVNALSGLHDKMTTDPASVTLADLTTLDLRWMVGRRRFFLLLVNLFAVLTVADVWAHRWAAAGRTSLTLGHWVCWTLSGYAATIFGRPGRPLRQRARSWIAAHRPRRLALRPLTA